MTGHRLDPAENQARRVTIRDVARAAGVAPSTVSKALNGSHQIPERTRERISEVARRISYRPNTYARTLRGMQSHTIGVLTDDSEGVFSTAILRGLERHVTTRGYSLFLCNTLGEVERERRHIEALMDKQVDGLILLDAVVARRSAPSADIGVTPAAYLYCYTDAMAVPCVIPDDRGGARLAVEHLVATGRRRIAHISGPRSGPVPWEAAVARHYGYEEALRQAGITVDASLVEEGDWSQGAGYRAARRLLERPDRPDAFFCGNDYQAVGVLEAVREAGLSVPDDVAIVGFDDRSIAATCSIPLTSVAISHEEMGRVAIERLFAAIDGQRQIKELIPVPCELKVRSSS